MYFYSMNPLIGYNFLWPSYLLQKVIKHKIWVFSVLLPQGLPCSSWCVICVRFPQMMRVTTTRRALYSSSYRARGLASSSLGRITFKLKESTILPNLIFQFQSFWLSNNFDSQDHIYCYKIWRQNFYDVQRNRHFCFYKS